MPTQNTDTSSEAERVQIELLRKLSPEGRLALVLRLNRRAKAMPEAGVRMRHPQADDREVRLRVASLWLDRDSMTRAFGWDPDVRGTG